MTPAGEILLSEIEQHGPVPFNRFMETALYHPEHGYYRRSRDPFGREGDFYTAEQVQPVFGMLIGRLVRNLLGELGPDRDKVVVELGAGRGEMAGAFEGLNYIPVDAGRGEFPPRFSGIVFANEFFDALPVGLFRSDREGWRELYVDSVRGDFSFVDGPPAGGPAARYLLDYLPVLEEGALAEVNLCALEWIARIARRMERGYLLAIDYGYAAREAVRFPAGTLMSYRRHRASPDVLRNPGEQDITAHVNFTALERHAHECGFRTVRFESLASMLLREGERDQFAAVLSGGSEREQLTRRLQLKTLLFGMGETFRALLLERQT
jgi:SAM-dependent MidA family methyltransferase